MNRPMKTLLVVLVVMATGLAFAGYVQIAAALLAVQAIVVGWDQETQWGRVGALIGATILGLLLGGVLCAKEAHGAEPTCEWPPGGQCVIWAPCTNGCPPGASCARQVRCGNIAADGSPLCVYGTCTAVYFEGWSPEAKEAFHNTGIQYIQVAGIIGAVARAMDLKGFPGVGLIALIVDVSTASMVLLGTILTQVDPRDEFYREKYEPVVEKVEVPRGLGDRGVKIALRELLQLEARMYALGVAIWTCGNRRSTAAEDGFPGWAERQGKWLVEYADRLRELAKRERPLRTALVAALKKTSMGERFVNDDGTVWPDVLVDPSLLTSLDHMAVTP